MRGYEELPAELKAFEAKLAALVPEDQNLDRARLLFEAGQAVARRRAAARARVWAGAFGAMSVVAALLLVTLAIRSGPGEKSTAGGTPPTSENSRAVVKDGVGAAAQGNGVKEVELDDSSFTTSVAVTAQNQALKNQGSAGAAPSPRGVAIVGRPSGAREDFEPLEVTFTAISLCPRPASDPLGSTSTLGVMLFGPPTMLPSPVRQTIVDWPFDELGLGGGDSIEVEATSAASQGSSPATTKAKSNREMLKEMIGSDKPEKKRRRSTQDEKGSQAKELWGGSFSREKK